MNEEIEFEEYDYDKYDPWPTDEEITNGKKSLEEEFEYERNRVADEMNACIKAAKENLNKAIEISEKSGIPFRSDLVKVYESTHIPKLFAEKYGDLELHNFYGDEAWKFKRGNQNPDYYNENSWNFWTSSAGTC